MIAGQIKKAEKWFGFQIGVTLLLQYIGMYDSVSWIRYIITYIEII